MTTPPDNLSDEALEMLARHTFSKHHIDNNVWLALSVNQQEAAIAPLVTALVSVRDASRARIAKLEQQLVDVEAHHAATLQAIGLTPGKTITQWLDEDAAHMKATADAARARVREILRNALKELS